MKKRQDNNGSFTAPHLQNKQIKHSKQSLLKYTKDDLRWATNELVADWRAKRLTCSKVADIGCGIGLQAFSLAQNCGVVVALDADASKIKTAMANAARLGIKNIRFLACDALSEEALTFATGCKAVFLDPERDASAGERKISGLKPGISVFLEKYKKITEDLAIEFPPQIQEVPAGCEREYASISGKLNRLTLYFGKLKMADVSVAALPAGAVLVNNNSASLVMAEGVGRYIYEADHAVHKAGLLAELCKATNSQLLEVQKHAYFTSDNKISSPFFKENYEVKEVCSLQFSDIINKLKKHGFGKVLIRYNVSPDQYWIERKKYEDKLFGARQAVLHKLIGKVLVCSRIE